MTIGVEDVGVTFKLLSGYLGSSMTGVLFAFSGIPASLILPLKMTAQVTDVSKFG